MVGVADPLAQFSRPAKSSVSDSFGRSGNDNDDYYREFANDSEVGKDPDAELRICKAINALWKTEYEVRKPHEHEWDRTWRRLHNRYDHSRKSRWQSQRNFPAVALLALKYQWEFTKPIILANSPWFEASTVEPEWQPLLDIPRDLVMEYLSGSNNPTNNFTNVWYEATFWGLITGNIYIRIAAAEDGFIDMTGDEAVGTITDIESDAGLQSSIPNWGFGSASGNLGPHDPNDPPPPPRATGFRIQFDALNPRYCVKDTVGRRKLRYFLQVQTMTKAEFRREGMARGWDHVDEVCEETASINADNALKAKALLEKNQIETPRQRDQVVLYHFYGTLLSDGGEELAQDSYMIMANRKHLVWKEPLPYWHGEIPIAMGGCLRYPGNPYWRSILGFNMDAQEVKVDLDNSIIDYLHQSLNPPTEVDIEQLQHRPHQLAGGLYPGKILEVSKLGNNGPAVARSGMPEPNSGVWQGIGLIKQEITEFTGMGDTASMPRTRNRISASEFKERAMASGGIQEQINRNLETYVLEPVVYQAYLVLLQKMPMKEWDAFLDRKIAALANRTHTIPPGSAAPPPPGAGAIPSMPSPGGGPPQQQGQQPGQPPPTVPGPPSAPGGPPTAPSADQAPPYEDPVLVEKYKSLQGLTPKERFVKLGGQFRFKVRIFTALEARREKLEKLTQLAEVAQGTPAVMARIKWHTWAEEYCDCLELDPEHFLWPNAGDTVEQPVPADKDSLALHPPNLMPGMIPASPQLSAPGGF